MQVMEGVVPRLAAVQASAQIYILLKSGNLSIGQSWTTSTSHYVTT